MNLPAALKRLPSSPWFALFVWLAGGLLLFGFDERLDLANKALLLVLLCALAAVWLSPLASLVSSAAAVLVFNFSFVPPRGAFAVDLHQHFILLLTMLGVSWIVALLMARQRRLADQARLHSRRAEQLRRHSESLREADDPRRAAAGLPAMLAELGGAPCALRLGADIIGTVDADEGEGLRICAASSQDMGQGSGRYEDLPACYLPLRGRHGSVGAALLRLAGGQPLAPDARQHAQALCDQAGLAIERADALKDAAAAHAAAQTQVLRNTLLSAIAHDHRTPLASILGAASALHDQDDRLAGDQRRRLAACIVDEAEQLIQLTENTLQLARLDAPGLSLRLDWESAEELVGTVLRRTRLRTPGLRLRADIAPGMPLLYCDAVLLVQLLENLVDNARKYAGDSSIDILVREEDGCALIAVRDRGPGVAEALRERIFEPFQRGAPAAGDDRPAQRGAGVGLAVCRAVARVHGGELRYRARKHGGAAFELRLPLAPQPGAEVPGAPA